MTDKNKSLILLVLGDALLSLLAIQTLSTAEALHSASFAFVGTSDMMRNAFFCFLVLFSCFIVDIYNPRKTYFFDLKELIIMLPISLLVSFIMLSFLYYFAPDISLGRRMVIFSLFIFGGYQLGWHWLFKSLLSSPTMSQRVLILGNGSLAHKIGELIASSKHNYVLAGYFDLPGKNEPAANSCDTLTQTIKKDNIHKLVVSLTERRGAFPLQELLTCKLAGVDVVDAQSFYEEITGRLLVEYMHPSGFIFSAGFKLNHGRQHFKRMGDIIFSLVGIAVTLPLLPIAALLIRIDSKGPIFFSQVRLGAGEKPFRLYKLRTMRADAERGTGAVWAKTNDIRCTRIGKFLRKTRIDEFPQFYNVLKGDMSFVGPRPERPEFVEKLKLIIPYYSERHCVKPGVTGWAQINYRYGASDEDALEKLRYDLYYIKHYSMFLDMLTILDTVKVMLLGKGAR